MKNKVLLALTFIMSMFFSITSTHALTKVTFDETSNGHIDTVLYFEEGFVGGIDATFKISGNVKVKDFDFAKKISSSNFTSKYKYNSDNHTLTIRVVAGGVGTKHNLLDSTKKLNLGKIVFSTSAKSNTNYSIDKSALKIVDNNWDSKTISKDNIAIDDKSEFVYKVSSTSNDKENSNSDKTTPSNKKDDDGTKGKDGSSNSTDNKDTNGSSNESKNSDGSFVTSEGDSDINAVDSDSDNSKINEKNDNDESLQEDDKDIDDDTKDVDDESKVQKNDKKHEKSNIGVIVLSIVVGLGIIVGGGYVFLKKRKI